MGEMRRKKSHKDFNIKKIIMIKLMLRACRLDSWILHVGDGNEKLYVTRLTRSVLQGCWGYDKYRNIFKLQAMI
jgi:hypothetical protein